MAAVKALQQWCRIQCEGYAGVSITNMTTSFRDGLAFCALIHRHRPDLINFDSLKKEDVYENNKLAFSVADQQLGIPALLDAEDMVALRVPDRLSILTYVSQYYNYFHGRAPIGGMAGVKRPAEGATEQQPAGKKNTAVTAKVFPSAGPTKENLPPVDHSRPQGAPAQRPSQNGTLSNKCVSCNKHVHLVQRHLVDGKLYHRNCAKTLTGNPFRTELSKNSSLSRPPPAPDAESPGPAPSWLTHRTSPPSSVFSTSSHPQPGRSPPVHAAKSTSAPSATPPSKRNISNIASTPTKTNSTGITTPPPHVTPSKSGSKLEPTAIASAASTSTPRTIASRNLQAKLKFFQDNDGDSGGEERGSSGTKRGDKTRGGREEEQPAPHSVTMVVQVRGKDMQGEREKERDREREREKERAQKEREKEREREEKERVRMREEREKERERVKREKEKVKEEKERERVRQEKEKERVKEEKERERVRQEKEEKERERVRQEKEREQKKELERERETERKKEREKTKEQSQARTAAAAFISKKVMEVKPASNQTHTPAETPKTEGVRGRVRLRADPSLLSDLNTPAPAGRRSPSPRVSSGAGRRSPSPRVSSGVPKPGGVSQNTSAAQSESPSDWRSRLKPVPKDPSLTSSPQPQSKPWTNGSDPSQSTAHTRPAPKISVTAPTREGPSTPPSGSRAKDPIPSRAKTKVDFIPEEEILKELQQIEDSLNELEKTGVELELKLRTSEENGEDESVMNELMVEWFSLIRNKQVAMRRESELVYIGRTQELEEEQPTVEQELRRLLDKPEHLKMPWERRREETLMKKLVEIVNDRNAIVDGLDEDRLREEEEDEQLNQLMKTFNLKKSKKKSPMSRLFSWGNKDS